MAQVVSLSEAAKLSNNLLVEGIVADIISVDEFFEHLPFVVFEGLAYTFTREQSLAAADFASPGANLNAAKYQAGATFANVNVNLTAIIAEVIIDGQINDQLSESNDQLTVQISSKSKAIARLYMNAIINAKRGGALIQSNNGPIGLADKFYGMASILDAESGNVDDVNHPFYNNGSPTQSLDLVEDDPSSSRSGRKGRVMTLEDLDDLIDRVTGARPDFLMMHSRDIRVLRVLLRNTGGGTDSTQIMQKGLGNSRPQLFYQDIPVFRNDFISRFDPVEIQSLTVSSITDADTIVLSGSVSAHMSHLMLRGSDGVMYRFPIVSGQGSATIDCTVSGSFFDPEQNKLVSRVALNGGLFVGAQAAVVAERLDGSSIYCGCWGELKGVCGFTSANNAGLKLEYVGPREDENAYQYRMKWYIGFELYNRLNLARMKGCLALGA